MYKTGNYKYTKSFYADMAKVKDKTVFGVTGVILVVMGAIMTIPLALRGKPYVYGLPVTTLAIIGGIILIAWAVTDSG